MRGRVGERPARRKRTQTIALPPSAASRIGPAPGIPSATSRVAQKVVRTVTTTIRRDSLPAARPTCVSEAIEGSASRPPGAFLPRYATAERGKRPGMERPALRGASLRGDPSEAALSRLFAKQTLDQVVPLCPLDDLDDVFFGDDESERLLPTLVPRPADD